MSIDLNDIDCTRGSFKSVGEADVTVSLEGLDNSDVFKLIKQLTMKISADEILQHISKNDIEDYLSELEG